VLLAAALLDMLLRYRRAGAAIPAARAAVLALGGYCAACGAAAAIGRGAAATASALEPRYTIISIVGVVTALTLAARFVPSVRWRRGRPALPWILALLGLLPLWPLNFNEKFETLAMSLHNQLQLDAAALRANIDIDAPMTVIDFAPVASRANTLRFLKDARLTFFGSSFDPPARIAAWFAAMDPATMPPCATGKLHAYGVDPASLVVNGWVADPGRHATAPWVAIKSAAKVLATAASDQPFIVPRRAVRQRPGLAFVAGLADPPPAPLWLLAAYASGKGGCAWQVPQDWAGVLLQPLPPASANAARLGNWPPVLAGGFAAGADPGAHLPPPAGTTDFVSTSKAGDAALGAATLHLDWPKESSQDLLLPVATGPNTANQWLELQFADGKGVAFPMPFFARPNGEWRVLVIRAAMLAAHGGGVTITAHDDGKNWGQWIAIAQPFAGQVNPTAGRLY